MSLTVRKVVVFGLIGAILLLGNILLVANWLAEKGVARLGPKYPIRVPDGTAIAIGVVLLMILLVSPRAAAGGFVRRCPVCDHALMSRGGYCSECGSRV